VRPIGRTTIDAVWALVNSQQEGFMTNKNFDTVLGRVKEQSARSAETSA